MPRLHSKRILRLFSNTRFQIFITMLFFFYILRTKVFIADNNEKLIEEALRNIKADLRYAEVYRKKDYLPHNLKYILMWKPADFNPFYYQGDGQLKFLTYNCSIYNCYVTSNKEFFNGDLTKFDAIVFNGRNLKTLDVSDLPNVRKPYQKYIFFNLESAVNYPVCSEIYNGFFNWTATYRLDSDIAHPYLLIKNMNGEIVGPKNNMHWINDMVDIDNATAQRLENKTKAVAWIASNCRSRSNREHFVQKLQKALRSFHIHIDIFGRCGFQRCSQYGESGEAECNKMLEKHYFFYLSLENSFDEDYVTEKLLTALQHDVVPIVYGGANYSKYLPPGSYLNGRTMSVEELALTIYRLIHSPERYQKYFRWKRYYTYHKTYKQNTCSMCAALNNKTKFEKFSVYKNLTNWWSPSEWCPPKPIEIL